ncbi:hypothetical protein [Vibrio phage vB_VhaP_PG11]|nr:hypothetical protein [Vibrio phage vB_VhaP_PG11]
MSRLSTLIVTRYRTDSSVDTVFKLWFSKDASLLDSQHYNFRFYTYAPVKHSSWSLLDE